MVHDLRICGLMRSLFKEIDWTKTRPILSEIIMASQTLLTKVHNWLTVGVAASVKLEAIGSSIARLSGFRNGTAQITCVLYAKLHPEMIT